MLTEAPFTTAKTRKQQKCLSIEEWIKRYSTHAHTHPLKEEMATHTHTHTHTHTKYPLEGGNGNPLKYSCLENSLEREAWRATFHRVTKSQT